MSLGDELRDCIKAAKDRYEHNQQIARRAAIERDGTMLWKSLKFYPARARSLTDEELKDGYKLIIEYIDGSLTCKEEFGGQERPIQLAPYEFAEPAETFDYVLQLAHGEGFFTCKNSGANFTTYKISV
jgi:hypothetical protein